MTRLAKTPILLTLALLALIPEGRAASMGLGTTIRPVGRPAIAAVSPILSSTEAVCRLVPQAPMTIGPAAFLAMARAETLRETAASCHARGNAIELEYGIPPYRPMTPTAPKPVPEEEKVPQTPSERCATLDPFARPEEFHDILSFASEETGVPMKYFFGVWMNETGSLYGPGLSDRCDLWEQLEIRCKVGGNCKHLSALEKMGRRFPWDIKRMTGSCGTSTMTENKGIFGGCMGTFDASPAEVEKIALDEDLDPMTFCGGAVILGRELKRFHDAGQKARPDADEDALWRFAMTRYYGADPEGLYYAHAEVHMKKFLGWVEQEKVQQGTLRERLKSIAEWSANRIRLRPPRVKRVAML